MANRDSPVAAASEAPAAPVDVAFDPSFDITLTEWCSARSSSDRRVELLSAFHQHETQSGRTKASAAAFLASFARFISRPA